MCHNLQIDVRFVRNKTLGGGGTVTENNPGQGGVVPT